jgi:5-methylcytosine-specific restriction endonuclease McrA
MSDLQPECSRCRHRHRPDLSCWKGRYRREMTTLVLSHSRACHMCGRRATEADHLIARSRGGGDEWEGPARNVYPACRGCNAAKAAGDPVFAPVPEYRPSGTGLSPRWRP